MNFRSLAIIPALLCSTAVFAQESSTPVAAKPAALVADGQGLMRHLDAKHLRTMERWKAREGFAA